MLIRTIGFNLQGCKDASLKDFFANLAVNTYRNDSTIMRFIERDGYWVGVLLSIRDQRSFCKMQEAGNSFTITIQQLQSNESPVEFNVFLINQKTLKGIYLHYYHSKSLLSALALLSSLYGNFKSKLIASEISALNNEGITIKKVTEIKKQIRDKYKVGLTYNIWVKPESFAQMVQQMDLIKNLELEVESVVVEDQLFRPLAEVSKSVKQKFSFDSTSTPVNFIKGAVSAAINSLGDSLINAKVAGVDPSGLEVMYSLANNIDYLSTYDYDDIVAGLEISSDDIEGSLLKSKLVTQIIAVAQSAEINSILNTSQ